MCIGARRRQLRALVAQPMPVLECSADSHGHAPSQSSNMTSAARIPGVCRMATCTLCHRADTPISFVQCSWLKCEMVARRRRKAPETHALDGGHWPSVEATGYAVGTGRVRALLSALALAAICRNVPRKVVVAGCREKLQEMTDQPEHSVNAPSPPTARVCQEGAHAERKGWYFGHFIGLFPSMNSSSDTGDSKRRGADIKQVTYKNTVESTREPMQPATIPNQIALAPGETVIPTKSLERVFIGLGWNNAISGEAVDLTAACGL